MEFKKLEVEQERGLIKRFFTSKQAKRSLIAIIIGAAAAFLYYYFTEGKHLDVLIAGDIVKSLLIGGFFGFFITNSPCARGRC